MKKSTTLLLILLSVFNLTAQEWNTDLDQSMITAKAEDKKVILVFSGSDWCAPCIKLDREVWETEEFKAFAKDNYILVKVVFPRKRKNQLSKEQQEYNNKLSAKYNQEGYFPMVVVLDADANVLGKVGYENVGPKEYIDLLESF